MAVHVYGVTTVDVVHPAPDGRQAARVRLVRDGGLAAIVSDVEADAPAGRKDLLAHAHVLEWFAERGTVLPMRFGVAMPSDEVVRQELLKEDHESLSGLLATFDGLVQVTVQAFHLEEPALREVLRRNTELRQARDQVRGLPEGAARDREMQFGRAVADALEDLKVEDRQTILDWLAALSRAVAPNEVSGIHEVANVAFLVEREGRESFDKAVGTLGHQFGDRLRIRYVGPQPPYSFLDAAEEGTLQWD
ncbi:MAG TPA: GvpL/GvpF family gas vesicle protein [Microlunatus sp.]